MKIAILADDFTGANDIGARLIEFGLNVATAFEFEPVNEDVIVIDSETRNMPEHDAYATIKSLFLDIEKKGYDKLYKKIDSTLRGNIKEELRAILEIIPMEEKIYVIPAFPQNGRVLINGNMYVNGVLLHESNFGTDPVHPMKISEASAICGGEIIKLKDIRENLEESINNAKSRIVIFDSEREDDIKLITEALVKMKKDRYIVGSAAPMRYLPELWGQKRDKVLILSGSCNGVNKLQIDEFTAQYNEKFNVIKFAPFEPMVIEKYDISKDFLICTCSNESDLEKSYKYYTEKSISKLEGAKIAAKKSASFAAEIIKMYDIRKIIVTGGETAAALMKELGINKAYLAAEIQTGVPLVNSMDMKYSVITKPGGFGDKKIFFRCYEILKNAENRVRH